MTIPILVTGCAGFIGFHVSKKLLEAGHRVIGIDNLTPYYDVRLKHMRLAVLESMSGFSYVTLDIADRQAMETFWSDHGPIHDVVHLAAQAGVRYSIEEPFPYIHSNIQGFMVILELCRRQKDFKHLVYASSSSVYGTLKTLPFRENMTTDTPMSLYAATKSANELMAQSYNHLYNLPVTGLRFFTVYGPWGRPDMSLFKFTEAILFDRAIDVYNQGQMARDYTYIDDIVQGIIGALNTPPNQGIPHHPIFNLAKGHKDSLMDFISEIENTLGKKGTKNFLPMQAGDVPETFADISSAQKELGYNPQTSIKDGIKNFIEWYMEHYYPLSIAS